MKKDKGATYTFYQARLQPELHEEFLKWCQETGESMNRCLQGLMQLAIAGKIKQSLLKDAIGTLFPVKNR